MDDYKEPSNNLNNGAEAGSDGWGQLMSDFGVKTEENKDNTQLTEAKGEIHGIRTYGDAGGTKHGDAVYVSRDV